jgi:hypothetical protein
MGLLWREGESPPLRTGAARRPGGGDAGAHHSPMKIIFNCKIRSHRMSSCSAT